MEVGGTFTDLVEIGPSGVRIAKTPSTPANPDEGAFTVLLENGTPIDAIDDLSHGSTVATNAVLERKGFRIAFVTTAGFRDILLMQRHGRSRIYDLEYRKPEPVVERADSYELGERILADGSVLTPLDRAAAERDLLPSLTGGGYQGVAICLLNAYVNPAHEEALRDIIRAAAPDLLVTISSDVTREFREFERASTTTLAAYVQPVIDRYIGRFEKRLVDKGFSGRFSIMQSNGGRLPADAIRRNPVNALLSGPAAGVMGATRQVGRSGFTNLLTLDMGGTSTDVSAVTDGKPHLTQEFTIDGLPIRVPIIDIHTIGAGGGSIVWVDEGGMLRVGPHSAGAVPGPACYMRGGTEPTLTDAHLICQTIRPEAFLGGRMKIDAEPARRAFAPIAERFGMSLEEAAASAIRLADANITRAIQLISTERGLDPRDYVLVPFGGAGPAARGARRRGAGRRPRRRAAQRRRHLGLWPDRLGLHPVLQPDAARPGRCRCRRRAARRLLRNARRGAGPCPRHAPRGRPEAGIHGRDALRRPGLRGAGALRPGRARPADRRGRRPPLRRGAPPRLFLRRRGRAAGRVRLLPPGRHLALGRAAAPDRDRGRAGA